MAGRRIVVVVVSLLASGCGLVGGGGDETRPLSDLLDQLPPEPSEIADVTTITFLDLEALGIDDADDLADETSLAAPELVRELVVDPDGVATAFGFGIADIAQIADTGPTGPVLVTVDDARASLERALDDPAWSDRADRRDLGDVEVVDWSGGDPDATIAPDQRGPGRPLGQAGQLAALDDTTLVRTVSNTALDGVLSVSGGASSLLEEPGVRPAVERAEDAGILGAFVLVGPDATPIELLPDAEIELLPRPDAVVLAAVDDDRSMGILAFADGTEATDAAEVLTRLLDGTSFRAGEPWTALLDDPEVTVDGSLVVLTIDDEAGYGRLVQSVLTADALLVWS